MSDIPVPTLCRLEYLTPHGWAVGHAAVNLLHPQRYVERLWARGKAGRATELDDRLQPTGQVWAAPDVDPSQLVTSDTLIPRLLLPSGDTTGATDTANIEELLSQCSFCPERHADGSCLI